MDRMRWKLYGKGDYFNFNFPIHLYQHFSRNCIRSNCISIYRRFQGLCILSIFSRQLDWRFHVSIFTVAAMNWLMNKQCLSHKWHMICLHGLNLSPVSERTITSLYLLPFSIASLTLRYYRTNFIVSWRMSYKRRKLLTVREHLGSPRFFVESVLPIFLVYAVVVFLCLSRTPCVLCA